MSGKWFGSLLRARKSDHRNKRVVANFSRYERLEARRLLAVGNDVPSIQGVVFADTNDNGQINAGEGIANATLRLFQDDGDGVFETNGDDVQVGADVLTDADGNYYFDNVSANESYFVLQPEQVASGFQLDEQVSLLQLPGSANLVIDTFDTNQEVVATSPAPASTGGNLTFSNETEVIGGERDILAQLLAGVGEVELIVNPFNLLPVLQYNSSSGVEGRAVVTWDGVDSSSSETPAMGLGGRDLTQGGINTGIAMNLGIDDAGSGNFLTLRIYQGDASNFSSANATIPITDGTAAGFVFIPFSDFSGPVSADNVDAIQMFVGQEGVPSADGQIDTIGVLGPKVANFANAPTVDLSITKSNTTDTVVPGESISYTITVENLGPIDITAGQVQDTIPTEITSPTFSATATGGATGYTEQGSGDIDDTVNMPSGSTIVYTISGIVDPGATGSILNTAIVSPPTDITDSNTDNNQDTETDNLTPTVDLAITKDDGITQVQPNGTVNYTIVVSNVGPSDVIGATVIDNFPSELTDVSYTSAVNGTANGNTNGIGNINDTVNISAGSSITYDITASVVSSATGSITNTAVVTTPQGTIEFNTDNNTATDVDTVIPTVDLTVTKTDNVTEVEIGEVLNYVVTVGNDGPSDVSDVSFVDTLPSELTNVSYTSSATGGAAGNSPTGTGDINETLELPASSQVTYLVEATVDDDAVGPIANTATVTAPAGVTETNTTNNTATDVDTVALLEFDLSVTKTDDVDTVLPGGQTTYTIVIANDGPGDANDVLVEDILSSQFSSASFTSEATNGASGNTVAGTGNITDTVDLPAGSNITYELEATIDVNASGPITNEVTVTPPAGTVDPIESNNIDTDSNTLAQQPGEISGFTYVDANRNGQFGASEIPLRDVAIQLRQNGVIVDEVFTGRDGAYAFTDLIPGTYTVTQTLPQGYNNGEESITGEIGEIVGNDEFLVTLGSGDVASGLNFGELARQPSKRSLLTSSFRTRT